MTIIHHPNSLLPADIGSQIAAFAREAETLRDLHPRQWALIHEQKWLRMFIPKSLGGLGLCQAIQRRLVVRRVGRHAGPDRSYAAARLHGAHKRVVRMQAGRTQRRA